MDVLHDFNWATWLHINDKLGTDVPKYVMQYTPLTKDAASTLSDMQYADDVNNLFPIDTKENTWLSAAYFGYNGDRLPYKRAMYDYVKERIESTARLFGIEEDVKTAMVKVAEPDVLSPTYGLTTLENGKEVKHFPMYDAYSVVKCAERFSDYRFKYTSDQRRKIAANIIKQADIYNVNVDTLPVEVRVDGMYGLPDKVVIMDELLHRAKMSKTAELSAALANIVMLVGGLPTMGDVTSIELEKLADVVNDFDKAEGLDTQVRRGSLLSPEDIVFSASIEDVSASFSKAVKIADYVFDLEKLASLPISVYEEALGEETSKKIKEDDKISSVKLAALISTLAPKDRELLEAQLKTL